MSIIQIYNRDKKTDIGLTEPFNNSGQLAKRQVRYSDFGKRGPDSRFVFKVNFKAL